MSSEPQSNTDSDSGKMSPSEVQTLILRVQEEARGFRWRRIWKRIAGAVIICAVLGLLLVSHFKGAWGFMQLGKVAIGLIAGGAALSQGHKKDIGALADLEDPAAIGPLAETLHYEDKDVRSVSEDALIRILPLARGEHATAISPEQLGSLHRELAIGNAESHSMLMRAIMRALPVIGDEESLGRVRSLAHADTWSTNTRLVRETAEETLPMLEKHVEEKRLAASLLRPVETPPDGSAILLRPAAGGSNTSDDSLLRPVENTYSPGG